MGIWNSVRLFSSADLSGRWKNRRRAGGRSLGHSSYQSRDLRMEQFEDRLLLSISPAGVDEDYLLSHKLDLAIERAADLDRYSEQALDATDRWVVGLSEGASSEEMAAELGADSLGEAPYLPDGFLWQFSTEVGWQDAADALGSAEAVEYFYPLVATQQQARLIPNDPLFSDQWHLRNTGQTGGTAGADANVELAWNSVLGAGVVIGIVDDGLEHTHEDLVNQYRSDLSYDFNYDDPDPFPDNPVDNHGTAVAGVAAAEGNNLLGVSGAAPGAELAGLRLISDVTTDAQEATALTYLYDQIDIYNNSWGPIDIGTILGPGPATLAALDGGVTSGRGGLGSIYTWAGGNGLEYGDNSNYDGYANSRYTIAVGAIDHNGVQSYYSEPGANLMIVAYSNNETVGITTTDRTGADGYDPGDYTDGFGGTSSATPLVSGVIGLMLEANANLTWRDVQYILAESAEQNDPADSDWTTNIAGYHINHKYGFGAIDAVAAVQLADGWENVLPETAATSGVIPVDHIIPDNDILGITSVIAMPGNVTNIEHVEVTFDADHTYLGDLEVVLISPQGTESILAEVHDDPFSTTGYDNWMFSTVRNWGEYSGGDWTLRVRDLRGGTEGTFNSWELTIYGQVDASVGPELISIMIPAEDPLLYSVALGVKQDTLHVGPQSLVFRFNEGQDMIDDEGILRNGIQMIRSGGDGTFGDENDVVVEYGWIGIGDRPNEVIARFAETLPDDRYQINLIGSGDNPLTSRWGTPFHGGEDLPPIEFDLDLGAMVTAVVPQPISRARIVHAPAGADIADGDTFVVAGGVHRKTFEFDTGDGLKEEDNVPVVFSDTSSAEDIAQSMESAIGGAGLGLSITRNNDILTLEGLAVDFIQESVTITMVDGTEIGDKDTFTVSDAYTTLTFEFEDRSVGNGVESGHVEIEYSPPNYPNMGDPGDTATQIANAVVDAIERQGLVLSVSADGDTVKLAGAGVIFDFNPQDLPLVAQLPFVVEDGGLQQHRDVIEVYFNNDDLTESDTLDARFFQLISTQDTADTTDDLVFLPNQVDYDPATDKVVLTFDDDLENLDPLGTGNFRLRIGNEYQEITVSTEDVSDDAGSSFDTAAGGWTLGGTLIVTGGSIEPTDWDLMYTLEWPGGVDEPGHRELPDGSAVHIEDHYISDGDVSDKTAGITTLEYNFRDDYGFDPYWNQLHNIITETQKERTRELLDLLGHYMGVQFVETFPEPGENTGPYNFTIATGDVRSLGVPAGLTTGVAGPHLDVPWSFPVNMYPWSFNASSSPIPLAVMSNSVDWGTSQYGLGWFTTAMHEVMHLMGLGHAYDQAALTIMAGGQEEIAMVGNDMGAEPIFPGDHDIVSGRHLYRPDSNDIDIYTFTLGTAGLFSAETIAERLDDVSLRDGLTQLDSSLLDSVLTLYNGDHELIARNDDYYSEDSYIELELDPGTYYIAVTSTGNTTFDPTIEYTGVGGTTEGDYELRLNFTPNSDDHLADTTGTLFDGDADGIAGGVYNFWLNVQTEDNTVFVDKVANPAGANGSLTNPYNTISDALDPDDPNAAKSGDILRIVGNAGVDGALNTLRDNLAYEIGFGLLGNELDDGWRMEIPQGVTVMIDMDAIFKLRSANVDAGSSAQGIDRSLGHVQVLGTPGHSVYFTSYYNEAIGYDTEPLRPVLTSGDWGGLVFRNNLDYDHNRPLRKDDPDRRTILEEEGIFLNYVNHADISYGGGEVTVNSIRAPYNPIHLFEARPAVSYNTFTNNANAAISADPNSFADNTFYSYAYTADYDRVGPDIVGNRLVQNSVNGILVRIDTPAGQQTEKLEVAARWDDLDIVHVVSQNLLIDGTPGGPELKPGTCPLTLVDGTTIRAVPGYRLRDGQFFTINDGTQTITFEFDIYDGITPGTVQIPYSPTSDTAINIAENIALAINGTDLNVTATVPDGEDIVIISGPVVLLDGLTKREARLDARLAIDPGIIVKLNGARIETEIGAQLIAEGTKDYQVIFTSLLDDTYGTGGTFETNKAEIRIDPVPGDWGGIYFGPISSGSIDHALIAYGGGTTPIYGGYAPFSPVEIHQASVRLTNSCLTHNTGGTDPGTRDGHGFVTPATIFVRGAQPVIAGNIIRDNPSPAMSVNVNALNSVYVTDWGRSTGRLEAFDDFPDNHGPLVRANRMEKNNINGMVVRGGTMTTQGIWDDTDIVHVVYDEIIIPNHHTFSGLRLQSSAAESLVVKLSGDEAGFTALGEPQEIDDRLGGSLQIIGTAGHPVVLTALADDTFGTGLDPRNQPLYDTNNDGNLSKGQRGAWRSIKLERYVNDRNVQVVSELEQPYGPDVERNINPTSAQWLGELSDRERDGDDNRRLGFEIHGFIRTDAPEDMDVYAFKAEPGTEVWFDIDRTWHALDTVVELIDADGKVLAGSDDSFDEQNGVTSPYGLAKTMDRDTWLTKDFYSTNPRDAGMRVVLPGPQGAPARIYYVRVRSAPATKGDPTGPGITKGSYQMQIRLRELQELPGSNLCHGDIHFATNGIELYGLPTHSPLLGETAETTIDNDDRSGAQYIGNLLNSDRNTLEVAGNLWNPGDPQGRGDVDWYEFTVDLEKIQDIPGLSPTSSFWSAMFDVDYADGMERPDTTIWVFTSDGTLIYRGRDSNNVDDRPGPMEGADLDNLRRGTVGAFDPFIGTTFLQEGNGRTYYVAVTGQDRFASSISEDMGRLEPITSVRRIVQDHIGYYRPEVLGVPGPAPARIFNDLRQGELSVHVDDYHLGNVVLFVVGGGDTLNGEDLYTLDPFTGAFETDVTSHGPTTGPEYLHLLPDVVGSGFAYGDIDMREDGHLFTFNRRDAVHVDKDPYIGRYREIDTGNGTLYDDLGNLLHDVDDEINTYQPDPNDPTQLVKQGVGVWFDAFVTTPDRLTPITPDWVYAVGNKIASGGIPDEQIHNLLYWMWPDGTAVEYPYYGPDVDPDLPRLATDVIPLARLLTSPTIVFDTGSPDDEPPGATDLSWPYGTRGDIEDGATIRIADVEGTTLIFEFDCGPDIRFLENIDKPSGVRDGDTFLLDDGDDVETFEFDSGPVLVLGIPGEGWLGMMDGATFTVHELAGETFTFEFDTNGTLANDKNIVIDYDPGIHSNSTLLTAAVVAAVNGVGWSSADPMADYHTYQDPVSGDILGRVSFLFDQSVAVNGKFELKGVLEGRLGSNDPAAGNTLIPFEEIMDVELFGQTVATAVQGSTLDDIRVGYAHRDPPPTWRPFDIEDPATWWYGPQPVDRMTFYHAVEFAFDPRAPWVRICPIGPDNDFIITAAETGSLYNGVQIMFQYSGVPGSEPVVTYDEVARQLVIEIDPVSTTAWDVIDAINDAHAQWLNLTATADANVVELDGKNVVFDNLTSPLLERQIIETASGNQIHDEDTFWVYDGTKTYDFEFEIDDDDDTNDGFSAQYKVDFDDEMSKFDIANQLVAAINATDLAVTASRLPGDHYVAIDGLEVSYDQGTTPMPLSPGIYFVTSNAVAFTDEEIFSISDGANTVTFEFEDTSVGNGLSVAGQLNNYVLVPFSPGDTAATIAGRIADLINDLGVPFVAGLDTTEAGNNGTGLVIFDPGNPFNLGLQGTTAGGIEGVPFFQHVPGTEYGISGHSDVPIPFDADDDGDIIAESIAAAINAGIGVDPDFMVTAQRELDSVILTGVKSSLDLVFSQPSPLTAEGEGIGGNITGMAFMGEKLYGVTDEGGLYEFEGMTFDTFFPAYNVIPSGEDPLTVERVRGQGPRLKYIGSVLDEAGEPIKLSSLTPGPPNTEETRYAGMFFATDENARMYAFDPTGELQPVFLDGATSVELEGITNPTGLAFSTVDYNSWHLVDHPGAGGGMGAAPDGSRGEIPEDTAYYFGGYQGGYKVPGGTYGSLTSDTFSLLGYDPADDPTLYFSYNLDLDSVPDPAPTPPYVGDNLDSVRVFISNDGANWTLLSSSLLQDEVPPPLQDVGESRQARVDLSRFAGKDNLRLRFDFSTAGTMGVGETMLTGSYLKALPGTGILDGDTFEIDGQVFEFDMGYSLLMPNAAGKAIEHGDTITLENVDGDSVTFVFDKTGAYVGPSVPIYISDSDSTLEVAQEVEYTIRANAPAGVTIHRYEHRVHLQGAYNVTVSAHLDGPADPPTSLDILQGDNPGIALSASDESTVIPITLFMTAEEVADAMALAADQRLTGSRDIVAVDGSQFLDEMTFTISDGVNTVPIEFNLGYSLEVPLYGGQVIIGANLHSINLQDGEQFTLRNGDDVVVTFEFEDLSASDGVKAGNVEIAYNPPHFPNVGDPGDSADEVLQTIFDAINAWGPPNTTAYLLDGEIYVEGAVDGTATEVLEGLGFFRRLPSGVLVNDGDWFTIDDDDDPLTPPVLYEFNEGFSLTSPVDGGWSIDDGETFTIENVPGDVVVFEFNLGFSLDIPAAAAATILDGDTFTINDGLNPPVTFEFDDGFTLDVPAAASANLVDGDTFTIDNGIDAPVIFEFDTGFSLAVFDNAAMNIADGEQFTIENAAGDQVTFEFDKGFTLDMPTDAGLVIDDGEMFTIDNGTDPPMVFEFDKGVRIVVPPDPTSGGIIDDTETFTIKNGAGDTLTFEFVNLSVDGDAELGNAPIEFNPDASDLIMAQAIFNAINEYSAHLPDVTASLVDNEVHLSGAASVTLGAGLPPSLLQGDPSIDPTSDVGISIQAGDSDLVVAQKVFNAILAKGPAGVTAMLFNDLVHLAGAVHVDPSSGLAGLPEPFVADGHGVISPGADVEISISLTDTRDDVLIKIYDAIAADGPIGVTPHLHAADHEIFLDGATEVTVTDGLDALNMLVGDGVTPGNVAVQFNPPGQPNVGGSGDSPTEIAQAMYDAILVDGPAGVAPYLRGDEVYLSGAADVTPNVAAGPLALEVLGDGVTAGNVAVGFNPPGYPNPGDPGDSEVQIAQAIHDAVAATATAGLIDVTPHLLPADDEVHLQGSTDVVLSPNLQAMGILNGEPPGAVAPGAVEVRYWKSDTHAEVLQTMYDAIAANAPAGVTPLLVGDRIHLPGSIDVTLSLGLQGLDMLEGDLPGDLNDPTAVEIRFHRSDTRSELVQNIFDTITANGPAGVTPILANSIIHLKGSTHVTTSTGLAFWFSGDPLHELADPGAVELRYQLTDSADEIARLIAEAINTANADPAWTLNVSATAAGNIATMAGRVVFFDPGDTPLKLVGNRDVQWVPGTENDPKPVPYYTSTKVDESLIHVIGHTVTNPGRFPYADWLPGDVNEPLGMHDNNRGRYNDAVGLYIDDIIIGFAERGEMVTRVSGDDTFGTVSTIESWIPFGEYQLEVRRGTDFVPGGNDWDTNDRLREAVTLFVPRAGDIGHGDTFTISDGVNVVTYQFLERTLQDSVAGVPIYFNRSDTGGEIGNRIVTAVNATMSPQVTAVSIASSNRVDLFGAAWAEGVDYILFGGLEDLDEPPVSVDFPWGSMSVTPLDGTTAYALQLIEGVFDLVSGEWLPGLWDPDSGITIVGTPDYTGSPTSAGFWQDDTNAGIILTTGSAFSAFGPNIHPPTPIGQRDSINVYGDTGLASGSGDSDLDAEFGVTTADTTTLEFEFTTTGGGVIFDFVFASDEYDDWVETEYEDVFACFVDGKNVAFLPDTTIPISTNTVNDGDSLGANSTHPEFYNDNDPDNRGVYWSDFGFDGFTNVFRAVAGGLSPEETHTVKFVISDGLDKLLDSAVLIRAHSFTDTPAEYTEHFVGVEIGDQNLHRDQGWTIVERNRISDCLEYGIVFDSGTRDGDAADWPHPGSVAPLREINTQRLVPGVMIQNNLLAYNGLGGIHFSGDPNPDGSPTAAVPFGRIVNNTIYGGEQFVGTGILVTENASPTILNNILANLDIGIDVDDTSSSTVLGCTIYQNNLTNVLGIDLGDDAIELEASEPLFVDPIHGNFYLAEGAQAIDNSIKSLDERDEMWTVRDPLGIDRSPILAPEYDLHGQLRVDDPGYSPPTGPGTGGNVFIDRGAIDRVDFTGPTAGLIEPEDWKGDEVEHDDRNPIAHDVFLVGTILDHFKIQLQDNALGQNGIGIDDYSVVDDNLELIDGRVILLQDNMVLEEGLQYFITYNTTQDIIRLDPAAGIWTEGSTYTIILDNSADGIRDLAGNPLQPNRAEPLSAEWPEANCYFTISLSGLDFGDAPDPPYPSLRQVDRNGARHVVYHGYCLGEGVNTEIDAHHNPQADGDLFDDGVVFETNVLVQGEDAELTVTVKADSPILDFTGGYLDAWIDFDQSGNWDDGDERVFSGEPVVAGVNSLELTVPADAALGTTFARFRFTSQQTSLSTGEPWSPTGEAPDGEVEDYLVVIVEVPEDFGDAPDSTIDQSYHYPTLLADDGARHVLGSGIYLGPANEDLPDAEPELDGQPDRDALGDDNHGTDDENGVTFKYDCIVRGEQAEIIVSATVPQGQTAWLNAWIDFNPSAGDAWGPDEHFCWPLNDGDNFLEAYVPDDAELGETFARFRISTQEDLLPTGPAPDGEVEDYLVVVKEEPKDFGDAPDSTIDPKYHYPTRLVDNGAYHLADATIYLGNDLGSHIDHIDFEDDGLPDPNAQGDDNDGIDDEDGVTFDSELVPGKLPAGEKATITVTGKGQGYLYAWVDFDQSWGWSDGEQIIPPDRQPINFADGPQTIPFVVPKPEYALAGWTFARVRFSTQETLLPTGPAPDGEVEDYQVEIVHGDAKITGWKWDDRNANGRRELATEPGLAGWTIYLDANDNKQYDIGERVETTREDDLATPGDETGYYEFTGLFPDDYVIRELLEDDWVHTYPDTEGDVLPSGAVTHYTPNPDTDHWNQVLDAWYTAEVSSGQTVTEVNFGNYKVGHITISDVAIAEGNHGETEVELTVHLTESFGAPVEVFYYTQDGTATGADHDYKAIPESDPQSITFTPGGIPDPTWNVTSLTTNALNDYDYHVSGSHIVWEAFDGNDWEIYLDSEDNPLTDNDTDDRFAAICGNNVVWSQFDGNDYEILLYRIDTGAARQLTAGNSFDDKNAQVSDDAVVWWRDEPNDIEIYYMDISGGGGWTPINISNNDHDDFDPQISGKKAVWFGYDNPIDPQHPDDSELEIYLYDGATGEKLQLTTNSSEDARPVIDGDNVVWGGHDGWDYEIFLHRSDLGTTTQITTNGYDDVNPQISGSNVVWNGFDGGDREIYYYNMLAGGAPINLSDNTFLDEHPQVCGDHVVWHQFDGSDWEVFYYQIGSVHPPCNVSNNAAYDWYPQVSEYLDQQGEQQVMVVWRSYDGQDYEILVATEREPELTATITLVIYGDLRIEPDEYFYVNLVGATFAEIEDDQAVVEILNDDGELDYGDAPAPYPTLLADNGARHVTNLNPGLYLGARVDAEGDGQPDELALGDDHKTSYDEDGVTLTSVLIPGSTAPVTVTASDAGLLDAWIDFNADGDWEDTGEQISNSRVLVAGENVVPFDVPSDAELGTTYARFRFSSSGGLSYTGNAMDGEVEDYALEITSGMFLEGSTLAVPGTDGDDVFEFTAGNVYTILINGTQYQYLADQIDNVLFNGGAGDDTAILNGSDDDETVELRVGSGRLTGDGLVVDVSDVESITATGGGGFDVAKLFDSPGDDQLVGRPASVGLSGDGFANQAQHFDAVHVYAVAGGTDVAKLFDSAGDDTFYADPIQGVLYGAGFYNRVKFFESVHTYATAGGADLAKLHGSDGNDTFLGRPVDGVLFGQGFYNRAKFFEEVHAHSNGQGFDVAKLFDSPGNDQFIATPTRGELSGEGFYHQVNNFDGVHAYSTAGGFDVAKLFDSPGNDSFYADPVYGALCGSGFYNRAKFFDGVHSYGTAGGYDVADLFGSAGNDKFISTDISGALLGSGFYNRAKFFEQVNAHGDQGGHDEAYLHDSAFADYFEAEDNWARLSNASLSFAYTVEDFAYVKAISSSNPGDTRRVVDHIFMLEFDGDWEDE